MHARHEYINTLRTRYCQTRHRQEKSRIFDEYCANTDQNRKYVIRKIRPGSSLGKKARKKRKPLYNGQMVAALSLRLEEIFDYLRREAKAPLGL